MLINAPNGKVKADTHILLFKSKAQNKAAAIEADGNPIGMMRSAMISKPYFGS